MNVSTNIGGVGCANTDVESLSASDNKLEVEHTWLWEIATSGSGWPALESSWRPLPLLALVAVACSTDADVVLCDAVAAALHAVDAIGVGVVSLCDAVDAL
eukprot:3887961-Pyramimonas_sp.AAC.1